MSNPYKKVIDYLDRAALDHRQVSLFIAKNHPTVFLKACEAVFPDPLKKYADVVKGGNLLLAIRMYREDHPGTSLSEAKELCEGLR